MNRLGPKHVKLTYVMNKTQSLKNLVYLVGLHVRVYYKMIHGPYNSIFQIIFSAICHTTYCKVQTSITLKLYGAACKYFYGA